jgi:predicted dinucleotide-binding enzyme
VVKTLNIVTAAIMVNPQAVADGEHDMFVCGNDASAKEVVIGILKEFGWKHITDLGDLSAARAMEMYLPIWLRLWGALGSGMFNIKIAQ